MIDETHAPDRKSWVESANRQNCAFPIQNLPLGVFRARGAERPQLGTAIGDWILPVSKWLPGDNLNSFCALIPSDRRELRRTISRALEQGAPQCELTAQNDCEMLLPCAIGDYTDFYASLDHAMNVGRMFRPDHPLLPNYKHLPIAYHGRASSIVVSGTPIQRPNGQIGEGRFGDSQELDYELELGFFLGPGNALGKCVPVAAAEDQIAAVCLLNDWSARDIQRWEYQPLGPFLAKNFATSISPWLVTLDALAPFRTEPPAHDTPKLPYLLPEGLGFDIELSVALRTPAMREPMSLSSTNFARMYWTAAQMIAHHTSNGCSLRPGDLIASGTVSGPEKSNRGCLLELTWKGSEPLMLPSGETRRFLEDGDEVILSGCCRREGFASIALGECRGTILAARNFSGSAAE